MFFKHFFTKFKDHFLEVIESEVSQSIQEIGENSTLYIGEGFTWRKLTYEPHRLKENNIGSTDEYIRTIVSIVGTAKSKGVKEIFIYPPKNNNFSEADYLDKSRPPDQIESERNSFGSRDWRLAQYKDQKYRLFCQQSETTNGIHKPIFLQPRKLDLNKGVEEQLAEFGFIKEPFRHTDLPRVPNIY